MIASTTLRTLSLAALLLVAAAASASAVWPENPSDGRPADGDPSHTRIGPLDPSAIRDFWLAAPGGGGTSGGAGGEAWRGTDFVENGDLPEGDTPAGVVFTPDGSRILVAHRDSKNVIVYDAATRDVLAVVDVLAGRADVAADYELPMSLRREPRTDP
jgi:YVTN family beta-propeller protein